MDEEPKTVYGLYTHLNAVAAQLEQEAHALRLQVLLLESRAWQLRLQAAELVGVQEEQGKENE